MGRAPRSARAAARAALPTEARAKFHRQVQALGRHTPHQIQNPKALTWSRCTRWLTAACVAPSRLRPFGARPGARQGGLERRRRRHARTRAPGAYDAAKSHTMGSGITHQGAQTGSQPTNECSVSRRAAPTEPPEGCGRCATSGTLPARRGVLSCRTRRRGAARSNGELHRHALAARARGALRGMSPSNSSHVAQARRGRFQPRAFPPLEAVQAELVA
jgi:hypothetical protein